MTERDNRLMDRASGGRVAVPVAAPARDVRVFLEALERLGYDGDSLLSAAKLDRSVLSDPDARVPAKATGDLICEAERQGSKTNMALRVAIETPIGAFPLLDYLIASCDTVGEAVHALARYLTAFGSPVVITIREDEEPIRIEMECGPGTFSLEYTTALLIRRLRVEAEGRFEAAYVSFKHRMGSAAEFERLLVCAVRESSTWSGVAVSRGTWNLPMRRRDPILRGLLGRQAEEARNSAQPPEGLVDAVRRVIGGRLGGDIGIQIVARDLGVTPRTLQRRLASEGLAYETLREIVLQETAEHFLGDTKFSIGELAYLLGYSEAAAFHRAFKRWTGMTPQSYRERSYGSRRS